MPRQTQQPPEPTNAVVVFDAKRAGDALTARVRDRRPQLAALLSLDIESTDPKVRARAEMMLERFTTVALHAATSNRDLLECTTESLVESIRQSAILGLEPTGALGDGAIVRYNNAVQEEVPSTRRGAPEGATVSVRRIVPTAQFQPMYRGLLKLARRSDQIRVIDAAVVYAGDAYDVELGTEPRIRHVPWPQSGEPNRGEPVSVYAFARLTNGELVIETATVADVEAIRRVSKAKDSGPWATFWSEMARAKILRRLMKRLPLESAAEHAIRLDAEAEGSADVVASRESAATVGSAPRARLLSRLGVQPADSGAETEDAPGSVDPTGGEAPSDADDPETSDGEVREVVVTAAADMSSEALDAGATGEIVTLCGKASPYGEGQSCRLPKGHSGPHQADANETWL